MINLKRIDGVVAAYAAQQAEPEQARLRFFRALWAEQHDIARDLAPAYRVPPAEAVERLAGEKRPILRVYPARIRIDQLVAATRRMAAVLCAHGGFDETVIAELSTLDWKLPCMANAAAAGSDPALYLQDALEALGQAGLSEQAAPAAASALSLALRGLLDPVADDIMAARDAAGQAEAHPVDCPVCGGDATLAVVGAGSGTAGGQRTLFCAQCGANWKFERIRCARCGTRNQGHLHYYHVGDDDAHRIHTCDECGGYIRTVFQKDLLSPIVPDVENAVMATLDLVARRQELGA